jgi:NhaA family Na+:H+ antiporter
LASNTSIGVARSPLQRFIDSGVAGGGALFLAVIVALIWANSASAPDYFHLRELPVAVSAGDWSLSMSLEHWVNDALMAAFFLLVGLEIKRELLVGELSRPRQAALAVFGAIGGMVVPALLYIVFNAGGPGGRGWGIPMATDIAFALGVLALLGSRVPIGLKVFLTALAIVDDLGAVLVIALFYTSGLDLNSLLLAGLVLVLAAVANLRGVRHLGVYGVLGIFLWYLVLRSGVHATVAGVLLAFTVPIARTIAPPTVQLTDAAREGSIEEVEARLGQLESRLEEVRSPLHRLEHGLQPWVAFLILPIFAFFNAGLSLGGMGGLDPISLGVALGLVLGKPIGIVGAAYLSVRLGLAALPAGVDWRRLAGAGVLGGIGFTMSLFVANLAFGAGDRLESAKLGVLAASAVAAVLGVLYLRAVLAPAVAVVKGARPEPPR